METELKNLKKFIDILSVFNDLPAFSFKDSCNSISKKIFDSLIGKLKGNGLKWIDKFVAENAEIIPYGFLPWITQKPKYDLSVLHDTRIPLSVTLSRLYVELAECLENLKQNSSDEFIVLSVQQTTVIIYSLHFYVLSQFLPWIDNDIGVPPRKHPLFQKPWTSISKVAANSDFLFTFLYVLEKLENSNVSIKNEIACNFLTDIIIALAQMKHLEIAPPNGISRFCRELPGKTYISALLFLIKLQQLKCSSAKWFTAIVGSQLSSCLRQENGVYDLLAVYIEQAGLQFWENIPFLRVLARQLALPPRKVDIMFYYQNITEQIFVIIIKKLYPVDGMLQLINFYVQEMCSRSSLAGDVYILDRLFKPFELLVNSSNHLLYNDQLPNNMYLLSIFSNDNFCPKLLSCNPRFIQLMPLFLGLLTSQCFDSNKVPVTIKSFSDNIFKILKFLASKVDNLSCLLLSFALNSSDSLYEMRSEQKMVVLMEEELSNSPFSIKKAAIIDKDDLLLRKLDVILKFLKSLDSNISSCFLIEIVCESFKIWVNSCKSTEQPRFISTDETHTESQWLLSASHTVALFCFEQIGEWDVDPNNKNVVQAISKLITIILNEAVEWMRHRKNENEFIDIRAVPSSESIKIKHVRQTSVSMAVGLAAAVVAAGTLEVSEYLKDISTALTMFVKQGNECKEVEMEGAIKDANDVLELLNLIGVDAVKVKISLEKVAMKPKLSVDAVSQLKEDLNDELIPVRGEALLRASKAIRKRDKMVLAEIELWLYDKVHELLADSDSYVYLSAINTLAEIACYDVQTYLPRMMQLYLNLKNNQKVEDDSIVIVRGKLGEAIGKVFRVLGDLSPKWIDPAANIFLNSLKDDNDIIRASALSVFSDLILSCKGRGLQKILVELFSECTNILKIDKSDLVRRSAIHVLRQCLSSCSDDIFQIDIELMNDLTDILKQLRRTDKDHVVRLHAEICFEEISTGLKNSFHEVDSRLRIIKIPK